MRKVSFVRRPRGKTRCACIVLAFLLVSLLAVVAPSTPSHGIVLNVAAHPDPNPLASNNVSVLSDSISLGGSLHVEGIVSSPDGPWDFVTAVLHTGDKTVARTQANQSGAYVFSVPIGLNYVPAVFPGGANVYTVTEPRNPADLATPSAVVRLSINAIPAYGIVAGLEGIVVLELYIFTPDTKGRFHIRSRLSTLRQRLSSGTRGILIHRNARKVIEESAPALHAEGIAAAERVPLLDVGAGTAEKQAASGSFGASRERLSRFANAVGFRRGILLVVLIIALASVLAFAYRAWGVGASAFALAVIVLIVALGIYVRRRGYGRVSVRGLLAVLTERLSRLIRRSASDEDEGTQAEPVFAQELPVDDTMLTAEQRLDVSSEPAPVPPLELDIDLEMDLLTQAPDLFAEGNDRQAISVLYSAALTSLAKKHGLELARSMTHRERFGAVAGVAPEVRVPLGKLTAVYERVAYAGKSLTAEQRNAAIEACESIREYVLTFERSR